MNVIEYTVHLRNGHRFHTGGFKSIDALKSALKAGHRINGQMGNNDPSRQWHPTWINPNDVSIIQDKR